MEFNATFIVAFVSFILFTIVMNLILYKPLGKIVDERHKFVDDNYKEASEHKDNAKKILADKAEKLEKSKADAKSLILSKSEEAKCEKSALTLDAQKAASKSIEDAKSELYNSKAQAQAVLSDDVVGLAQVVSSKILGENTTISEYDRELVGKIIQEG